MNMQILDAQVLIDVNGTRVGDITPLPTLTTPFVSTPNQNALGNYWPIWLNGPIHFQAPPAQSGLIIENFENNFVSGDGLSWHNDPSITNIGSGTVTYQEPLLRGGWPNTAWLGTPSYPFWQIYAHEVWAQGGSYQQSDARLKTNIESQPKALNKLMELRPVVYDKIDINENTPEEKRTILNNNMKNQHGFLAQEILEVYPELVGVDNDGYYGVNYIELISIMIKAMQEQQAQIDSLK